MKHTYIFTVEPNHVDEDDLYRLNKVVMQGPTSCRSKSNGRFYTEVQVFTTPGDMHRLAHAAGFSGEQLRRAIPAARQRGDEAMKEATKRMDKLRIAAAKQTVAQSKALRGYARKDAEVAHKLIVATETGPIWMAVSVDRLRKAGCDIQVHLLPPNSYEVVVFGDAFNLESSSEVRGFLAGLEKGFSSAPQWAGVEQHIVPRDQFDSVLELINDHLSTPAAKRHIKALVLAVTRAKEIIRQSLKAPSHIGSPQMGSTPATRRSKRSA